MDKIIMVSESMTPSDLGIFESIRQELMSWPGVTSRPHRFGGIEFRVNGREMGHLHGDQLADLPFPKDVGKKLIEEGRARINQMSVPDVPSSKLSAIVKNVFSSSDMQSAVSAVAAKNVGNVYVTARSYTSLPSYFVEEVKTASITTVP